ncbi:potential kinesin-14 [Heterostelium album PN500]|uniref:Kinesin-like protein n=1 Tax=Heterostelium pallidum (strain ATCC 26659 / Pp 5 / PN500) TaxID=670386 RepID=D3B8J0_HETP5|nr:potential kinesin-14 [Heterostelium album PN500]EFA82358.1 potential kinesin-14 [Heterostelium album PN500]|eukprot:XP_020434475.1 potential kinesin-14 [Heterostelium album PN500]
MVYHENDSGVVNDNVKVCVRARGLLGSNEVGRNTCLTALPSQNAIMINAKPDPKLFAFDYVADEHTTQEQLFDSVARPLVDSFIGGYNACIFAYGQTGSGKSYTIMGGGDVNQSDQNGLIPRTFQHLFTTLNNNQSSSINNSYEDDSNDNNNNEEDNRLQSYKCTLSFLEIYNEQIMDLFVDTSPNLSIREDIKKGIYVEGLREIEITDTQTAMELLEIGIANRHVAETAMNSNSSRSHSVLTINLESTVCIKQTKDGLTKNKYSRLSLIDLAGSERQKSTEAAGTRLKEAGSINKSLSCLGNVIRSLVDLANGKPRHVQYRDSKLTFLLKRAKNIRNMAIVNEEASGSDCRSTVATVRDENTPFGSVALTFVGARGIGVAATPKDGAGTTLSEVAL